MSLTSTGGTDGHPVPVSFHGVCEQDRGKRGVESDGEGPGRPQRQGRGGLAPGPTKGEWRDLHPNGAFLSTNSLDTPPDFALTSFYVGNRYRRSPRPGSIPFGLGYFSTSQFPASLVPPDPAVSGHSWSYGPCSTPKPYKCPPSTRTSLIKTSRTIHSILSRPFRSGLVEHGARS